MNIGSSSTGMNTRSTVVAFFERVLDDNGYRFDGPYLGELIDRRNDYVADLLVDTGSGPKVVEGVHHLLAPLVTDQHPTFYLHHWRGVRSGDNLGVQHAADLHPDWLGTVEHEA